VAISTASFASVAFLSSGSIELTNERAVPIIANKYN
jgi:hypothetical protein